MSKIKISFLRLLIAAFVIAAITGCQPKPELQLNESITCDLEQITEDGKYFMSNSNPVRLFEGAEKRSDNEARSGKYSVLLMKGRSFGLTFRLNHTGADEYYLVSVWRKGDIDRGFINVGDDEGQYFYKATEAYDSVDVNGWKRLSLTFHVPPNLNNATLKVYVWNPNNDSVYFDDITIRRLPPKKYPEYEGITGLSIFIDTVNTLKLAEKRKNAFNDFILATEDDDWVEGMFFQGDELFRTELRLKGDWLDHLRGAKWSFRIEVKNGQTWMGMRTFSIQNPQSRDFLNEWLMHEFCREQDILATRYGFIPVSLNNKSLGIYAWEEHFEKYLIEYNSRREGPILKVNENALWESARLKGKYKEDIRLPVVLAAEIMPFKTKKTTRDSALYRQYLIAQNLYFQYKYAKNTTSEVFDIDKLARYMAMIDLFRTYHGITWHNQRFYYNPVISKLEPITFDNFGEQGPVQYFARSILGHHYLDMNEAADENIMLGNLFRDTAFNIQYIRYLEEYSNERFLQRYMLTKSRQIYYYDSLIRMEYPGYAFDKDYIFENARRIRDELPEFKNKVHHTTDLPRIVYREDAPSYGFTEKNEASKQFVQAYREDINDTGCTIRVENFFINNIILLGSSKSGKSIRDYLLPEPELGPVSGRLAGEAVVHAQPNAAYLHYMIPGDMTTYVIPVYPWPRPDGKNIPAQEFKALYGNNFKEYFAYGDEKNLIMEAGQYEISSPIVIPPGYRVTIKAGAELNLVNNAAFISYSTLNIIGTANKPVIIKSSDRSANGFSVFQAPERSLIKHAIFDRLNTLDHEGWTLTGAVTFYESDVDFYQTTFQNNLCEDGLNIIRSDFTIDQCELLNTFSDALDVDFGQGSITNSNFSYLGNDGIDVSGSRISVNNCLVTQSNDKAISAGENSQVEVMNTRLRGAVIGIASKDQSSVIATDCNIEDANYGVVVFRKKAEFGPATFNGNRLEMKNVTTKFLVEEGSSCEVNGEKMPADKKNVYDLFYN